MADAFVSYSRKDRALVVPLVEALRAPRGGIPGKDVWVDLDEIVPSALWMAEVKSAIAAADSVIFAVSPDSVVSEVCRSELDEAVALSKRIIPVEIRPTEHKTSPAPLPDINWLSVGAADFDADVSRLIEVLDTDIEQIHLHTRLLVRASEWESREEDRSLLLRGRDLIEAERWQAGQVERKQATTPSQARLILASRRATTRRQRGSIIGATAITLTMAMVAAIAVVQWHSAGVQRNVAVSRELAVTARSQITADPQLALLLALRAYDTSPTTQAQDAVRASVRASTLRAILPDPAHPGLHTDIRKVGAQAFDDSGNDVAVFGDQSVDVWTWQSSSTPGATARLAHLPIDASEGRVVDAQFERGAGRRVIIATSRGTVLKWDWTGPAQPLVLAQIPSVETNGDRVVLGPGGAEVATFNIDDTGGTVHVLSPADGTKGSWSSGAKVSNLVFSPDGNYLAGAGPDNVQVWTSPTGDAVATLPRKSNGVMAFSPDDTLLAIGGIGAVVYVAAVAQPDAKPVVHPIDFPAGLGAHCCDVDQALSLLWSPNGVELAAGTEDDIVRVWVGNGDVPVYLDSAAASTGGVAFSADGQYLVSGGRQAQVWAWAANTEFTWSRGSEQPQTAFFSPDGRNVAIGYNSNNGPTVLLDWRNLRSTTLGYGTPLFNSTPLSYSTDGKDIATVGRDGAVAVWDTSTDHLVAHLPPFDGGGGSFARFSPDGSVLAVLERRTGTKTDRLVLWPWRSGASPSTLEAIGTGAGDDALLGFAPGGQIGFFSGKDLKFWDGDHPPTAIASMHRAPGTIDDATFLPGNKKALLVLDQQTQIFDPATGKTTRILSPYGSNQFSLSADAKHLAVSGETGFVEIWDLSEGDRPVEAGAFAAAPHVGLNTEGSILVLADVQGVRVLPIRFTGAFPEVLHLARSLVVRTLTPSEEMSYPG